MDKMFDRSIPEIRSNVSVSGSKRDSPGETEGKTPVFPKSTNLKRQKLSDNLMDGNGTATRGVAKKPRRAGSIPTRSSKPQPPLAGP